MGWNGAGRPAQVPVRSFVEQDLSVRNRLDEPSSEDWRGIRKMMLELPP